MNCSECHCGISKTICNACRMMQHEGRWKWEIDTGQRLCRCPDCGFGNFLSLYAYKNPFRYCAGCGHQMIAGEQMSIDDILEACREEETNDA